MSASSGLRQQVPQPERPDREKRDHHDGGGEALYADMGHFGARAIRVSWFTLVFPALALGYLVVLRFGYMDTPHVPSSLVAAFEQHGIHLSLEDAMYCVGRETFIAGKGGRMGTVAESIFAVLSRNGRSIVDHFGSRPSGSWSSAPASICEPEAARARLPWATVPGGR